MLNLIIPQDLTVGFQKRTSAMDGNLSFITYKNIDGNLFNKTRFNNWIDKEIPIKEFSNNPQSGFVLGEIITHGNRFSGNILKVRIYSTTHDVEFEIDVADFLALATYTNIQAKYIEGDCVLAWESNQLRLISTKDPIYKEAKEASDLLYNPNTNTTAKEKYDFGDIFLVKSHHKKSLIKEQLVYLGQQQVNKIYLQNCIKNEDLIYTGDNQEGHAVFDIKDTFLTKHVFGITTEQINKNEKNKKRYSLFKSELFFIDEINNDELVYVGSKEDFAAIDINETQYNYCENCYEDLNFKFLDIDKNLKDLSIYPEIAKLTLTSKKLLQSTYLSSFPKFYSSKPVKILLENFTIMKKYSTSPQQFICVMEKGKNKFKEIPQSQNYQTKYLHPIRKYSNLSIDSIS